MIASPPVSGDHGLGAFEYLLILAAVIFGLALSDLASSLHRLLDAGKRVRWDWLAPLAAIVAFLKIVTQWWAWFGGANLAKGLTFEMYIGELAGAILLFLLAAAALPDKADEPVVDLAAHYAHVTRRYWLLFAAQLTLSTALSLWAVARIGDQRPSFAALALGVLVLALILAFVRNRWLHTICLIGLSALYVLQFFGKGIGAAM